MSLSVVPLPNSTPIQAAVAMFGHVCAEADRLGGQIALHATMADALAEVIEYAHAHGGADDIVPQLCDLLKHHANELRERVRELGDLSSAREYARNLDAGGLRLNPDAAKA